MIRFTVLVFIALTLAGCVTVSTPTPDTVAREVQHPPPSDGIEQVQHWLRYNLKDYESARIELGLWSKSYSTRLSADRTVYFGWEFSARVNARNSWGAYAGWSEYVFFFHYGNLAAVYEMKGGKPYLIEVLPPRPRRAQPL